MKIGDLWECRAQNAERRMISVGAAFTLVKAECAAQRAAFIPPQVVIHSGDSRAFIRPRAYFIHGLARGFH